MNEFRVYLEVGKKRAFAGALDWPGWVRGGRGEESALEALLACGGRFGDVVSRAGLMLTPPKETAAFKIIERLEGNASTEFGAPGVVPQADSSPLDAADLIHQRSLLKACWAAFDAAVEKAAGKELRKGPRGGGRDLDKILGHVLDADRAYLRRLAWKPAKADSSPVEEQITSVRVEILQAMETAVNEGLPETGPRGGIIWPPRYFIRKAAYHILDHAWEIEDRLS